MRVTVNAANNLVSYSETHFETLSEDQVKAAKRVAVLAELDVIDRKSIRAIREGDSVRVAQWETQAAALRAELSGL